MAEPLTLAALSGVVLTEGVRFLYSQASELIKVARNRRSVQKGHHQPDRVEVTSVPNHVLDGQLPSAVDGRVLDREDRELERLVAALEPYANDIGQVVADDRELLSVVHQLRALLEIVYGQRLTLSGENREPTGARVDVRQVLGEVEGEASALRAGTVEGAVHVDVQQSATRVTSGGAVVGAEIDRIGGGAA